MQMIQLDNAIQIAKDYYHSYTNNAEISFIVHETDNLWVIFGEKKGKIKYGGQGITIDKETGEVKYFSLPSKENFKILESAKLVEPERYENYQ